MQIMFVWLSGDTVKRNAVSQVSGEGSQRRTMEYERYKFVTKENKWKSFHSKGTQYAILNNNNNNKQTVTKLSALTNL